MTDQQITARCQQARDDIWNKAVWSVTGSGVKFMESTSGTAILESLYREAMAAGLEMACTYYTNQIHDDLADYPDKFVTWCRQEAQRVKEGK